MLVDGKMVKRKVDDKKVNNAVWSLNKLVTNLDSPIDECTGRLEKPIVDFQVRCKSHRWPIYM